MSSIPLMPRSALSAAHLATGDVSGAGISDDATDRLVFETEFDRLNHNVFRFPAKFHPPVVRSLVERYTAPGAVILDPFCGSGSTLVEAAVSERSAVGTDVDPLSVFVSRAKTLRYTVDQLERTAAIVLEHVAALRTHDEQAFGDFQQDISETEYLASVKDLSTWIPPIPRLHHWFRRRVVLQLAALRRVLCEVAESQDRLFLDLCFAAIIRNASNADPVPVSGLEVTRHMREREAAGRAVDPYALFSTSVRKALVATADFVARRARTSFVRVARADARTLSIRGTGRVDAIITSPPYLTAVDYYRRHQLEMYWLGLTGSSAQRLELLPQYLGRDRVPARGTEGMDVSVGGHVAQGWLEALPPGCAPERARAFVHYCAGMADTFAQLARLVPRGGPIVVVVGDVSFSGERVSMPQLLRSLAAPWLQLDEQLWYPISNRYMSYERKNGANIDTDHVLVFRSNQPVRP